MDCEAALGGAFDAILKTAPQFHFDTQLEQSFARGGDRAAEVDPYTIRRDGARHCNLALFVGAIHVLVSGPGWRYS